MDNVTHAVVGLGVGELVQRSLAPEPDEAGQRTRHRLLLTACAVASNFPDLDLLFTGLLPAPLGYLLHHRGHTHTLLFAVPQALLLLALLWALWPNARALLRRSAHARTGLAVAIVLGFCLHLAMDYLNSYGVHPFYPFDAHWRYGDAVFIVEPVFWVAFGVPLMLAIPLAALRWLSLALLAGVLLYFTSRGYLGIASCAALLALGAVLAALRMARRRSRRAMAVAAAISVAFIAVQSGASMAGRERVRAALHQLDGDSTVLDVVMTAFPSQPLCWNFVSVERNEARDQYRLRRGLVSLAPDWMPPAQCPAGLLDPPPHEADGSSAAVALSAVRVGSLAALRGMRDGDCRFDAWLRFARAPLLDGRIASDLRFAATPRGNFTSIDLAQQADQPCPRGVPGWERPRADLLTPALPAPH